MFSFVSPFHDEHKLLEMSHTVSRSILDNLIVKITWLHNGQSRSIIGRIVRIAPVEQRLKMLSESESQWIPFENLVEITIVE